MKNFTVFAIVLSVLAASSGQRITTIHLDGVQYFISRMNPYSPELNYFLAYQYCRSLGLQLASFETKEKAESMTTYLKNAGYGGYNFWTSGNRLGTKMFLWMSTGLPFNATFDFFENSDEIQEGILDPIDHNSNTSPQRTARDSGAKEKACVILQTPTLKWVPEDCFAIKDFICEQTRCYYYNYGSIPVSSAQGRPIASTTVRPTVKKNPLNSHPTTPLPHTPFTRLFTQQEKIATTTTIPLPAAKMHEESRLEYVDEAETNGDDESAFEKATVSDDDADDDSELDSSAQLNKHKELDEAAIVSQVSEESSFFDREPEATAPRLQARGNIVGPANNTVLMGSGSEEAPEPQNISHDDETHDESGEDPKQVPNNSLPVEVRLKQISQEIEQTKGKESNLYYQKNDPNGNDDIGRQSFLSLTDLIRTLRPSEKHVIIDSDYSNAMRVLGDNSMVNNNELRKLKNLDDTVHLSESSSFGL